MASFFVFRIRTEKTAILRSKLINRGEETVGGAYLAGSILVYLIFRKDRYKIFPVQAGDPGVLVVRNPDILNDLSEAPLVGRERPCFTISLDVAPPA